MDYKRAHSLLTDALGSLGEWMDKYPVNTGSIPENRKSTEQAVLLELARRLTGNYPFHSPVYAGQMLKSPHPVAWAAQALTALINPNNHALDGGPPTSEMEKEIIPQFAAMFGFQNPVLGHLTSSGTIANMEALWVASKIHPGKHIAFSNQAHYTHARMCAVLGIETIEVPVDSEGDWDMNVLEAHAGKIGTVVATLGTTGTGRVEPLHKILPFCREKGIRVHIDAAYGGYFKLISESVLPPAAPIASGHPAAQLIDPAPWKLTGDADSIVIDPHKHGLQPYGCGCVLFRDPAVGTFYKHDSPYTYFSSDDLHLGEISLECSRAGASAAALWVTMKVFPLNPGGPMSEIMRDCRLAAIQFASAIAGNYAGLKYQPSGEPSRNPGLSGEHETTSDYGKTTSDNREDISFQLLMQPELDIVTYFQSGGSASEISGRSARIFRRGMQLDERGFFMSLYQIPSEWLHRAAPDIRIDQPNATVLRSVFMKPEHLPAIPLLLDRLYGLAGE